ncbi:MAG: flagellar hook-length control protein FliK [Candidatus Carbobacillus altaicus]|nr:flagellar hook-length control protein FliK [Candidatus Carbobacillus altaicus]
MQSVPSFTNEMMRVTDMSSKALNKARLNPAESNGSEAGGNTPFPQALRRMLAETSPVLTTSQESPREADGATFDLWDQDQIASVWMALLSYFTGQNDQVGLQGTDNLQDDLLGNIQLTGGDGQSGATKEQALSTDTLTIGQKTYDLHHVPVAEEWRLPPSLMDSAFHTRFGVSPTADTILQALKNMQTEDPTYPPHIMSVQALNAALNAWNDLESFTPIFELLRSLMENQQSSNGSLLSLDRDELLSHLPALLKAAGVKEETTGTAEDVFRSLSKRSDDLSLSVLGRQGMQGEHSCDGALLFMRGVSLGKEQVLRIAEAVQAQPGEGGKSLIETSDSPDSALTLTFLQARQLLHSADLWHAQASTSTASSLPAPLKALLMHIQIVQQGGSAGIVHLRLEPEALGELFIRIHVEHNTVYLTVMATKESARAWLETHGRELKAGLEGQGLQLERLDIATLRSEEGLMRDAFDRDSDRRDEQREEERRSPSTEAISSEEDFRDALATLMT